MGQGGVGQSGILPEGFQIDKPNNSGLPEGFVVDQPKSSLPAAENTAGIAANPAVNKPQEAPSFAGDVSSALKERGANVMRNLQESTQGPLESLSSGVNSIGQVFGGAGDVLMAAGKSAYRNLPDAQLPGMTAGVKTVLSDTGKQIAESDIGQKAGQLAQTGMEKYGEFAQENPNVAKILEGVANVGAFYKPKEAVLKAAAAPVTGTAGALGRIAKGSIAPNMESLQKNADELFRASQNTVGQIKNAGVTFSPNVGGKIANEFERVMNTIPAKLRTQESGQGGLLSDLSTNIDLIKKGGTTDLHNLFLMRKSLNDIAARGGDTAPYAKAAVEKMDTVFENLSRASDKDLKRLVNKPEGVGLIKQFNKEYQTAKNFEKLMDVINPGEGKPELTAAQIRRKLGSLADSEGIKYFPKEIQEQIRVAAKGQTPEKILSAVGSLKNRFGTATGALGAIGAAATGNIPAAAALTAGTLGVAGAGKAAQMSTRGQVTDILKRIK
jgi:hypothetical protein